MSQHRRPKTRSKRSIHARYALTVAAAGMLVAATTVSADAGTRTGDTAGAKPTIVLVHGAWADPSSWAQVTERLEGDGYTVLAEPNPLRGLSSDAAYLDAFLEQRVTGPVILVGHSYGGAVITDAAAADPDVKALVYIDAFAPAQGESVLGLVSSDGGANPSAMFDAVQYPGAPAGDADLYIKSALFPQTFANDLPARVGAELAATQEPVTLSALTQPSGKPAWLSLPSWFLVGTKDNVIPPALQLSMAKRAHGHITEVPASHLSMISHPAAVTHVIEEAANAEG
ncbi:alpha/beta fold hydrolase [Streptacidiphilus sp. P02-A3a]|uniref:alpha/beta fold hydrolase n=1 Tax=Streptacidiphilus sp. P02-A3a TaxID=2704468 RepID=UPI0015FCB951|nr:alpha/beta hydrolase [Streptacidiphilus sp. P02-A3a]QMU73054.1 alpha/beta hydrolase [Streptacidiphilus sp. P02-A3a]